MKDGRVMQQGTPEQLFEAPASTYVGYFIGSPAMNFLTAKRTAAGFTVADQLITVAWDVPGHDQTQVGIRPEYVKIVSEPGANTFAASLSGVRDHGPQRVLELDVGGQLIKAKVPREDGVPGRPRVLVHLPRTKLLPYVDGHLATMP